MYLGRKSAMSCRAARSPASLERPTVPARCPSLLRTLRNRRTPRCHWGMRGPGWVCPHPTYFGGMKFAAVGTGTPKTYRAEISSIPKSDVRALCVD